MFNHRFWLLIERRVLIAMQVKGAKTNIMQELKKTSEILQRDIVFISTKAVASDKTACLKLCDQLDSSGIKYWCMHKNNIQLEQNNWQKNINQALSRAVVFVLLISKDVFQKGAAKLSSEIRNEFDVFKGMMTTDNQLRIIPVQLFEGSSVEVSRDCGSITYNYGDILENTLESVVSGDLFYNLDNVIPTIRSSLDTYKEQILVKHINDLRKRTVFLELQDYCLQRKCISSKVSDYILNSRELSPNNQTAELHIVTNEFWHYDFTALATLAISENIRKHGIKYIYYYPMGQGEMRGNAKRDFERLKNRVATYICRDDVAVKEFDMWFRSRIAEAHKLVDFLKHDFYGSAIGYIIEKFEFKNEELLKRFSAVIHSFPNQDRGNIVENPILTKWITAKEAIDDRYWLNLERNIKNFKSIIEIIRSAEESEEITFKNRFAASLVKNLECIIDLFDFSEWFTGKKDNEHYSEILDRLIDDNYIPYISETRTWIEFGNGVASGARINSEDSPDPYEIINKNLIGIEIPHNIPIHMCYSFCMYISDNHAYPTVAWYDCDSDSDTHATNIEENIFIFAPERITTNDANAFKNAYRMLIDCIPQAKEILKNNKCNYIINVLYGEE